MLFCDVFRKTVEPLSGSGRLISGEYDNSTKPCAVQAILESLMSLRSTWARYQAVRCQKENISMLPYFLTYSILLSTDIRRPPWLQTSPPCIRLRAMWTLCRSAPSAGEKRFWTCTTFPTFQHSGFYFPPAASKDRLSMVLKSKISWFYGLTANDDETLSLFPLSLQNGKCAAYFR